jgi:predicted nucleotidyltransferase
MIKPSSIDESALNHVKDKLNEIKEEFNITILLAIESGSRSWGFPSRNSDYDVRFIYARNLNDYLSVMPFRDFIETPIIHDSILKVPFDMNGWDIKKAMQLALKSNPVLFEWLNSPICYYKDDGFVKELTDFYNNYADLALVAHHYERSARGFWCKIKESATNRNIKQYCYVLRLVLAFEYIRQFSSLPPMDIYNLCYKLNLKVSLQMNIAELIQYKLNLTESDVAPLYNLLDDFIEGVLLKPYQKQNNKNNNEQAIKVGNDLFQRFLS